MGLEESPHCPFDVIEACRTSVRRDSHQPGWRISRPTAWPSPIRDRQDDSFGQVRSGCYSPNFIEQKAHCDHKPRAAWVHVRLLLHRRSAAGWAECMIYSALVSFPAWLMGIPSDARPTCFNHIERAVR